MEASPAAAMAPPPAPSSRPRDPLLLFSSFDLPAGWGCRRPMAFCRDTGVPDSAEPGAEPQDDGTRSSEKADAAAEEEAQGAPRKQWNLRDRTAWPRDYRAEDARPQYKKPGGADAAGSKSCGFSVSLTRQEIDADFAAITGRKPPRRPRRRPKSVQRQIETLCTGSSLSEVTRDRYKVNEKGGF